MFHNQVLNKLYLGEYLVEVSSPKNYRKTIVRLFSPEEDAMNMSFCTEVYDTFCRKSCEILMKL